MNHSTSAQVFLKRFWQVAFFLLVNSASAFLINLLVARWVGPRAFGDFFFFVSTAIVSTILFDFGLTRTLLRYSAFHQARGELRHKLGYYAAVLRLKILIGAGVLAVAFGLSQIWGGSLRWEISLGLLTGFIISFSQFLSAVAQTEENYTAYNLVLSFNTLRLAIILGLAVGGWISTGSLYVVFLAAPLLLGLIPGWRLGQDLAHAAAVPEAHFYGKIIAFGKWMIVLSVLETLHQRLDVILVRWLTSAEQAGYYAGALAFFGVVYLLPSFLAVLVYPRFVAAVSRKDTAGLAHEYRLSTNVMTMIAVPLALGLAALAPDLIGNVLGARYAASEPLFAYFAAYSLMLGCHLNSGGLFMAKDQPYLIVFIVGCTLGVNLAGNLLLIPRLGIQGAALSLCLATLVSWGLSWGLIMTRYQLFPSVKHVAGYILLGLVMAIVVRALPGQGWGWLLPKIMLGGCFYLGSVWVLDRWAGRGWLPNHFKPSGAIQ